jgi:hypothetical protein
VNACKQLGNKRLGFTVAKSLYGEEGIMTRVKILYTLTGMFFVAVLFQNCGGIAFEAQDSASRGIASLDLGSSTKLDCQFIGTQSMHQRLATLLGINSGDISILADDGTQTSEMRIEKSKTDLGDADPAQGLLQNLSCGMTKYKISAEVFIDACTVGMNSPSQKQLLFPQGETNFDLLYMALIGRSPTDYERGVLMELSATLPPEKRAMGVCAAVASSLESLIKI